MRIVILDSPYCTYRSREYVTECSDMEHIASQTNHIGEVHKAMQVRTVCQKLWPQITIDGKQFPGQNNTELGLTTGHINHEASFGW